MTRPGDHSDNRDTLQRRCSHAGPETLSAGLLAPARDDKSDDSRQSSGPLRAALVIRKPERVVHSSGAPELARRMLFGIPAPGGWLPGYRESWPQRTFPESIEAEQWTCSG